LRRRFCGCLGVDLRDLGGKVVADIEFGVGCCLGQAIGEARLW
jgi:hypothetical protein